MKKTVLTIMLMVFAMTMMGQKVTQGSMDFMKDVHEMSVEFIFDQAQITDRGNMPITDWGPARDAECDQTVGTFMRQLNEEKEDMMRLFVANASKKMKDIRFIWRQDLPYKMTCVMRTVNSKGQRANCDYIFTDTRTGETLAIVNVECKGGTFGTFTNLLGDSFKDAFGKVISLMSKGHKKGTPAKKYSGWY